MQIHGLRQYAEQWLQGILDGHEAQISQCLNDIEGMTIWTGPAVTGMITEHTVTLFGGTKQPLYHASAGRKGGKTCTLFFAQIGNQAYIVAVCQHAGSKSYTKVWTRPNSDFPSNITLGGKVEHVTIG